MVTTDFLCKESANKSTASVSHRHVSEVGRTDLTTALSVQQWLPKGKAWHI